jgi:hypothetical protein
VENLSPGRIQPLLSDDKGSTEDTRPLLQSKSNAQIRKARSLRLSQGLPVDIDPEEDHLLDEQA